MSCSSSSAAEKNASSTNTKKQKKDKLLFKLIVTCDVCGVSHKSDEHAHEFDYVENNDYHRDNDLIDSFTLEPLFEPMQLPCGHMFSFHRGIQKQLKSKKKCPLNCAPSATVAKLIEPPVMVKNTLNRLKVF
jgi:hypothetical protein